MPARSVVLFLVGPPFGGFRAAGRAGLLGLDHPEAFIELERAVGAAFTLLAAHPPGDWVAKVQAGTGFEAAVPRLGEREGYVDFSYTHPDEAPEELVARACLPFSWWPFGGWVVHDGARRQEDGGWQRFPEEEVSHLW